MKDPCKNKNCQCFVTKTFAETYGGECSWCHYIGLPDSDLRKAIEQILDVTYMNDPFIVETAKKIVETLKKFNILKEKQ